YQSATELANELGRYLAGEPIRARPASPAERLWKWARRRPGVATLSAAVLVLAVVGFTLVTSQWLRAESEWDRAEGEAAQARQAQTTAEKAETEAKGSAKVAEARRLQAEQAEGVAKKRALEAKTLSATRLLDHGDTLFNQGQVTKGLFWLQRGLADTPAEATELRETFRHLLAGGMRRVYPLKAVVAHTGPIY